MKFFLTTIFVLFVSIISVFSINNKIDAYWDDEHIFVVNIEKDTLTEDSVIFVLKNGINFDFVTYKMHYADTIVLPRVYCSFEVWRGLLYNNTWYSSNTITNNDESKKVVVELKHPNIWKTFDVVIYDDNPDAKYTIQIQSLYGQDLIFYVNHRFQYGNKYRPELSIGRHRITVPYSYGISYLQVWSTFGSKCKYYKTFVVSFY
jgi:hypothetical protein